MSLHAGFWRGRRVLVTGHSGFKGSWLALWLQSLGAEVHGLSVGAPSAPSLYELAQIGAHAVEHEADIRDAAAVRAAVGRARPQIVFHLAAQPLVRRSFQAPHETFEINVMGTVNLLEAVRAVGDVAATVVVTSDKCYENRDSGRPFVEEDPLGGHDPYSTSKGCAELVAASYRRSFGTRLATARAGNVIGGGDWAVDRLIPDMVRAASTGTTVRLRNPDAVRPWQHVLNPLSGYLSLAEALVASPASAEAWNFGPDPGDARPVRWIADALAARWPGGLRWEPDAAEHPTEAVALTLDSGKAARRLGWRPRWALEEALRRIVDWHAAHAAGGDMRAVSLSQIESFSA
ncbi:MAG TPA: CDP-glucose 4,6-dehydratase [Solirubrobacteraceae bacterium]|nr:CDP-glucose 4,6-dehydratase [Solirubrobacteraceae bacterium]